MEEAINCAVQHIKIFFQQSVDETMADFGEPCQTCPYTGNCEYGWLSIMEPLLVKSAIRINLAYPGHSNKLGNDGMHPGQDKGILRKADKNIRPSYNQEPSNPSSEF